MSPCARSATCNPCPMAIVPDSTVHCSRPPARNLDLSSSDHGQDPWVGFIYIQLLYPSFLKTAQACLENGLGHFAPSALPHYKHTLPRLARSTLNELAKPAREGFVSMCACTEPVRTRIGAVCVEYGRPKWPITMLNHTCTEKCLVFYLWHPMLV